MEGGGTTVVGVGGGGGLWKSLVLLRMDMSYIFRMLQQSFKHNVKFLSCYMCLPYRACIHACVNHSVLVMDL